MYIWFCYITQLYDDSYLRCIGCVCKDCKILLTRFYREYDGVGVTAVSERPYPDVVLHVRFERTVAVQPLVRTKREFLAIGLHADFVLDGVYTVNINDVFL